jgi:hypothetical protein
VEIIEGEIQPKCFLYISEIFSVFTHSDFTRKLNPLDDTRVFLKETRFKIKSHISTACFKYV